MQQETKRVLWEWLPGPIAGILPLGVFGLVVALVDLPGLPKGHPSLHLHANGLLGHILVFAMVTSSVSTFTSFPRLFSSHSKHELGPASLVLIVATTLTLVFSTALYTLHETHIVKDNMRFFAWSVFVLSLLTSLWIEFAIANLGLIKNAKTPDPRQAPAGDRKETAE